MSAIKNILKLLLILEDNHQVYNSLELADKIGVSERQVRNYVKELREFGFLVEGEKARGGGYIGQYQINIPFSLTYEEIKSLHESILLCDQNHLIDDKENLVSLLHKIKTKNKIGYIDEDLILANVYQQKGNNNEKEIIKKVRMSLKLRKKLSITYNAANDSISKRVICPYKLLTYNGGLYVLAFCEKSNDERIFKTIRMKEVELLTESFEKNYSKLEYSKQRVGIFESNTKVKIVVDFFPPYELLATEIVIGENYKWEKMNGFTRIESIIKNEQEIVKWLMHYGSGVRVVEPFSIRSKIKSEIKKMEKYYKTKEINGNNGSEYKL